ncbi:MAG: hypothetical protein ACTSRS_00805 [Candidatus Helarchaeota archaeon]
MESSHSKAITDFEEKEKRISEFEKEFIRKETELKELQEKYKLLEEQTSKDKVEKIAQYEGKIKELSETNERLRNALNQLQEENIQLEDELNKIKSEHADINELKSKMQILEETVITQQKEIIEKDKILKGRMGEDEEATLESTLQKFIVSKAETIKEFNRLLDAAKFRLFLIVPTLDDLQQLHLKNNPDVDTRIATAFDLSNEGQKDFIAKFPDVEWRLYTKKDRWGIERDAEEICIVAETENKDYIGISSSDSKVTQLFLKLLTEAWLTADKVSL